MDIFIQQIINGLVLGSMYALVALGYTMVYGIINLINFAHGEVLMVGALTSWTVVTALEGSGMPGWLLLLISVPVAVAICSTLNYTIEKVAYRPLRNAPRLAPLITAMGMSLLLQTVAMIVWKPNPKPFPILLPSEPLFLWANGPVISIVQCMILGLTAVILAGLMYLVNQTKLGRAMRATAENPRVAALMGVRPDMVISATFIIGATLAAVAGIMWAANYGTVQHSMGFLPGLKAFHFDLYRLHDPEELEFMGVRDYFNAGSLCLIEWPQRGVGHLPDPDLVVEIQSVGAGRRARVAARSERGREQLAQLG